MEKKELYSVITPGEIRELSGCGIKSANQWISTGEYICRKTKGPILVSTESILPKINSYRQKKGKPALTMDDVIEILSNKNN